jgi:hypothetical protein
MTAVVEQMQLAGKVERKKAEPRERETRVPTREAPEAIPEDRDVRLRADVEVGQPERRVYRAGERLAS